MENNQAIEPQAKDQSLEAKNNRLMIMGWLLSAFLLACAVLATDVTNSFEVLFSSFSIELPIETRLFLKGRYLWWLLFLHHLLLPCLLVLKSDTV